MDSDEAGACSLKVSGDDWKSISPRYASGPLACLPRVHSSGIPALLPGPASANCEPKTRELETFPFESSSSPKTIQKNSKRNGRSAPTRYYQRRLPSSTALLQIFHAAKPRAPTRTSRVPGSTYVSSYPTNYSTYYRPTLSTTRITQPHTSTSSSSGQIPLLRHSSRSFCSTSLRRPANTNPYPSPFPHT